MHYFYRFYIIYYRLYSFFMILYNLNITILQKTFFSPKKGPCGKMHTRQNIFAYFSHTTIESSHTTMESSQSTIESCRTTIESVQSTMKSSESRNTRKMVGFFITWLLYSQNPSRSNMAQPYRLIVWI